MSAFRDYLDFFITRLTNWFKMYKRQIIVSSIIFCTLMVCIFLYTHRPTFEATHRLTGVDEERVYVVETQAPPGSQVTMNKKDTQQVDNNGSAIFRILPNELKGGINKIPFQVKVPLGLSKTYTYNLEKTPLPVALKVTVSPDTANFENLKKVSVVTDPLNKISIAGVIINRISETGQDTFTITDNQILQAKGEDPAQLPDIVDESIEITAVNVDGKKEVQTVPVKIFTLTQLSINQPRETDSDIVTIDGNAPPNTIISVGDKKTVAGNDGTFSLSLPLTNMGPNIFQITAERLGEKNVTRAVTINKLLSKVELSTLSHKINGHTLTIEGTSSAGAAVKINGQPAIIEGGKFTWQWELPPQVSKRYTFIVEAYKEGYRNNIKTITVPHMPVYREPQTAV
ncbi:MAG: hypothetical protein FH756_17985 [Firmicutes bacterium]|nr:hypothetical protein [Bacillota bacterium]